MDRCVSWVQAFTTYVTQPFGTLFLRLIFMLVIPLLFSALVVGIAEMGDIRSLGRVGWRTLAYTVVVVTEGNAAPGLAYIAPYAATSIAEHFMQAGRDVRMASTTTEGRCAANQASVAA